MTKGEYTGRPGFIDGAPAQNFAGGLYEVNLPEFGPKTKGKVRDIYRIGGGRRIMIATDRQSAFDRTIGAIPDRGKVLNLSSAFWFDETADIVPNHQLAVPHPNVSVVREAAQMLPVEVVVRGYMAKSGTHTSVYHNYEKLGRRTIYGIDFPDGLRANEALPMGTIITPTTKGETDEELTDEDARHLVDSGTKQGTWDEVKKVATAVFERGQQRLEQAGIILADTKYEVGLDRKGEVMLADEVHTPDSSRFWLAETYQERFEQGIPPEMYDKQILRAWLSQNGFDGTGQVPVLDGRIKQEMRDGYSGFYRRLTGRALSDTPSTVDSIRASLAAFR